jgi:SAM-dependent methyltransferase
MAKVPWRNRIIYRLHDEALAQAVAQYAKGDLVDIGWGKKPYANLLKPFVKSHVGVDHQDTLHGLDRVDLVGTAYSIPVPDETFDTAMSTAVLEHLEEPAAAIREAKRVLRKGGVLILTAPFFWHLHEAPRDFYRYSPFGLRHLLESNGFEVVDIRPLAGYWVTASTQFLYYISQFEKGWIGRSRVIPITGAILQWIASRLDRMHRDVRWSWMHLCVARKPAE